MMKKLRCSFFSFLLVCLSGSLHAVAYNKIIATIPVGNSPAGITITPDNRFAYVANSNNEGIPDGDTVSVINLRTNRVEKTIKSDTFKEPYRIAINRAGTKAYVANDGSSIISIIDIRSNTVIGIIDGFDGPSGMVITSDDKKAYVNNYGSPDGSGSEKGNTVHVVDLQANKIIGDPIIVPRAPQSVALSPNGNFVYAISYVGGEKGAGTLSVIDTTTNKVIKIIPGLFGAFAFALTSDGAFAYVTNFGSNNFEPYGATVSVIDLAINKIIADIPVGIQPAGIAVSPDDRFVYVANYNTLYLGPKYTQLTPGLGTISVIDRATNTVCALIAAGNSPDWIALTADGKRAYVTNYTAHTVTVLDLTETNNITKK